MRRVASVGSRYPRKVTAAYTGGANTVSSIGLMPGDPLVIPTGTWILDCQTPPLGSVTITGYLIADQTKDVGLTCTNINIGANGKLQIGSEAAPYLRKAVITLTGTEVGRTARFVPDVTVSPSGTGKGKLLNLLQGTGATTGTYTVTFSSATAFTVSGGLGTGTVGTLFNNGIQFTAVAGATPWVATDTFTVVQEQRAFTNNGTGRSLQVQSGGKLILIGNQLNFVRTKINSSITAGVALSSYVDSVNWPKLSKIAVGPTDYYTAADASIYPAGNSETNWTKSRNGASTGGVNFPKYGKLQYVTDTGMSETQGTFTRTTGKEREILDQRATVLNLTRNIVIQGIDDSDWQTNGFGAHVMFMGLTSEIKIDSVELRRVGQAGAQGRYPIHWHMMSYSMPNGMTFPSDGTFVNGTLTSSLATGQYIKNSSVHQSSQRAIVVHGTCGVEVSNNNIYDVLGMAIFLEDGAERKNIIRNNFVIKVRSPISQNIIGDFDIDDPSGFWLSSPDNIIEGNTGADCKGVGIWNVFAGTYPTGLCRNVSHSARFWPLLSYRNNTGHSCLASGMRTRNFIANEKGALSDTWYDPRIDPDNPVLYDTNKVNTEFFRNTSWKNTLNGYTNRVFVPKYTEFQFADNGELDAQGQAGFVDNPALFVRHVYIGTSLNASTYPGPSASPRTALASYNIGFRPVDCTFVNYPKVVNTSAYTVNNLILHGGVFRTDDLYLHAIEIANDFSGQKFINSSPGYFTKPIQYDSRGTITSQHHATLSGIMHDVNHFFTSYDVNIMNHVFYTYGATGALDTETGRWGTADMYYGMTPVAAGSVNLVYYELDVRRYNGATEVAQFKVQNGRSDIASSDGTTGNGTLPNMRHFGVAKNGKYEVRFPTDPIPTTYNAWAVEYAYRSTDSFVVALAWSNSVVARGWISSESNDLLGDPNQALTIATGRAIAMITVANQAAVESATVPSMWQDTTNNKVWIKYFGGRTAPSYSWNNASFNNSGGTDWSLYLKTHFIILRA